MFTALSISLTIASTCAHAQALLTLKAPTPPPVYDWSGFYVGGHLGVAWGNSNWSTPGAAGSMSLAQPIDTFDEAGSFFIGMQAGYNYMLPNRWVIGVEADLTAPSFQNLAGISIGNMTMFNSPFGSETYGETCWIPAPCAAASVTPPETGSFTRPAASPGATTN